jgi:hypothetical protein
LSYYAELNSIGKEVLGLKQELKTQIELKETGTPALVQPVAKENPRSEAVHTQVEETTPSGMYKGDQGLGSGGFPLPTFDENTGVNAVSYLTAGRIFQVQGSATEALVSCSQEINNRFYVKTMGRSHQRQISELRTFQERNSSYVVVHCTRYN